MRRFVAVWITLLVALVGRAVPSADAATAPSTTVAYTYDVPADSLSLGGEPAFQPAAPVSSNDATANATESLSRSVAVFVAAKTAAGAARAPGIIRAGDLKLPSVPKGATGVPVQSGKGLEYGIPRGTPEIDPRVTKIRIMDPTTTGKYPYPNGYAVYMNDIGQTVNPLTGRVIAPSDPYAHIGLP